jgi:hypothetical protein
MRWRIWRSEIPKISGTWRGRIYRGVLSLLIRNSQWILGLGLKAGERKAGGFPFDWVPPVFDKAGEFPAAKRCTCISLHDLEPTHII